MADKTHATTTHLRDDLVLALMTVSKLTNQRSAMNLDASAMFPLFHIACRGPLRVSDLAEYVGLDASTISRRIRTLEDRGLTQRRTDPSDARASLLEITPKGTAQLEEFHRVRTQLLSTLMSDWSEEERTTFTRLTIRLRDQLADSATTDRLTEILATPGENASAIVD